jgi:hypothetical protein
MGKGLGLIPSTTKKKKKKKKIKQTKQKRGNLPERLLCLQFLKITSLK